jgi:hypothetical protein
VEDKVSDTVLVCREDRLEGCTYKLKTPLTEHALYITINNHGGRPFEIFFNSKAMEHFQWIVALSRVISAVFRKGGDVSFLVEELQSVFDPKGGYFKKGGRYMPSLVAEIGEVLKLHLIGLGLYEEDNSLAEAAREEVRRKLEMKSISAKVELVEEELGTTGEYPPEATLCVKCNTKAVILMDGCLTCLNCGDSKCG